MNSDPKIFPILLLRQLNFGILSAKQLFYVFYTDISISINVWDPLSANFTKIVQHTQTIRRQFADELFECV